MSVPSVTGTGAVAAANSDGGADGEDFRQIIPRLDEYFCHTVLRRLAGSRDAHYKPDRSGQRPSSSGLGRRPFTAETRVRVPLGVPTISSANYLPRY